MALGGDDPGVAVWQVKAPVPAGAVIDAADLQSVRVPLPDGAASAYVSAVAPLPADAVARRGVGAGELLPTAALESRGPASDLVPVPVGDEGVPGTIRAGSVVDVWVVPGGSAADGSGLPEDAEQILDDVTVVSLPTGVSLGGGAPRPLVVGVEADPGVDLGEVLAQLAAGTAVVIGQG